MKTFSLFLIVSILALKLFSQPFNVGHTSLSFDDPARSNRSVSTEIYYPALTTGDDVAVANGAFPYIVFGHGFLMGASDYTNISDSLVSKGFIVIYVTTESTIFTSNHENYRLDLSFISGFFYYLNSNVSSMFYGKIIDKKAIMGHSMGGGCTVLAAQNNLNVNTIICLSPMGTTTPSAISNADLVTVPALIIGASGDSVCPANSMGIPIYDSLSSTCKVFLSITGGGHCLFGNNSNGACSFGESSSGSTITITSEQQNDVTLDFITNWLNFYLKDNISSRVLFFDSLQTSPRITYMSSCNTNEILQQANNKFNINYFIENNNLQIGINNVIENNISIEIYNLLGQNQTCKFEKSYNKIEESITGNINLSEIPSGMYILSISDRNKTKGYKFIKK